MKGEDLAFLTEDDTLSYIQENLNQQPRIDFSEEFKLLTCGEKLGAVIG